MVKRFIPNLLLMFSMVLMAESSRASFDPKYVQGQKKSASSVIEEDKAGSKSSAAQSDLKVGQKRSAVQSGLRQLESPRQKSYRRAKRRICLVNDDSESSMGGESNRTSESLSANEWNALGDEMDLSDDSTTDDSLTSAETTTSFSKSVNALVTDDSEPATRDESKVASEALCANVRNSLDAEIDLSGDSTTDDSFISAEILTPSSESVDDFLDDSSEFTMGDESDEASEVFPVSEQNKNFANAANDCTINDFPKEILRIVNDFAGDPYMDMWFKWEDAFGGTGNVPRKVAEAVKAWRRLTVVNPAVRIGALWKNIVEKEAGEFNDLLRESGLAYQVNPLAPSTFLRIFFETRFVTSQKEQKRNNELLKRKIESLKSSRFLKSLPAPVKFAWVAYFLERGESVDQGVMLTFEKLFAKNVGATSYAQAIHAFIHVGFDNALEQAPNPREAHLLRVNSHVSRVNPIIPTNQMAVYYNQVLCEPINIVAELKRSGLIEPRQIEAISALFHDKISNGERVAIINALKSAQLTTPEQIRPISALFHDKLPAGERVAIINALKSAQLTTPEQIQALSNLRGNYVAIINALKNAKLTEPERIRELSWLLTDDWSVSDSIINSLARGQLTSATQIEAISLLFNENINGIDRDEIINRLVSIPDLKIAENIEAFGHAVGAKQREFPIISLAQLMLALLEKRITAVEDIRSFNVGNLRGAVAYDHEQNVFPQRADDEELAERGLETPERNIRRDADMLEHPNYDRLAARGLAAPRRRL